jgi:hypothetical protein
MLMNGYEEKNESGIDGGHGEGEGMQNDGIGGVVQ